jgi:hypothetical protein
MQITSKYSIIQNQNLTKKHLKFLVIQIRKQGSKKLFLWLVVSLLKTEKLDY